MLLIVILHIYGSRHHPDPNWLPRGKSDVTVCKHFHYSFIIAKVRAEVKLKDYFCAQLIVKAVGF